MIQVLELLYWQVGFCRLWVCDCPGAPVHSLVDEAGPKASAALLVGRIGTREIWSCCLPTGRWNWIPVSLSEGCWGSQAWCLCIGVWGQVLYPLVSGTMSRGSCVPRVSSSFLLSLWETLQDQQVGLI